MSFYPDWPCCTHLLIKWHCKFLMRDARFWSARVRLLRHNVQVDPLQDVLLPHKQHKKKHMMLFLFKGPDRRLLEQTGWRNTDKTWASLYFRSSPASTQLYNINAARQICKIFQHNSACLSVCRTKCQQNSALLIEINSETVNVKLRMKIVCKW